MVGINGLASDEGIGDPRTGNLIPLCRIYFEFLEPRKTCRPTVGNLPHKTGVYRPRRSAQQMMRVGVGSVVRNPIPRIDDGDLLVFAQAINQNVHLLSARHGVP